MTSDPQPPSNEDPAIAHNANLHEVARQSESGRDAKSFLLEHAHSIPKYSVKATQIFDCPENVLRLKVAKDELNMFDMGTAKHNELVPPKGLSAFTNASHGSCSMMYSSSPRLSRVVLNCAAKSSCLHHAESISIA